MIPANTIATAVVIFLFTNSPINVLSVEIIPSRIIVKGIIKLKMTWLYTNISGSRPKSIAIVVGITLIKRVTNLLNQTFTFLKGTPLLPDQQVFL